MGCCATRGYEKKESNNLKLVRYVESFKSDSLDCDEIEKVINFSYPRLTNSIFQGIASRSNIKIPFDILSNKGYIYKFELAAGLILFSRDNFENKLVLFNKLANTSRRKMHFLEYRYQISNEKIPTELLKLNKIDYNEYMTWGQSSRLSSGELLQSQFQKIISNDKISLLEVLSI